MMMSNRLGFAQKYINMCTLVISDWNKNRLPFYVFKSCVSLSNAFQTHLLCKPLTFYPLVYLIKHRIVTERNGGSCTRQDYFSFETQEMYYLYLPRFYQNYPRKIVPSYICILSTYIRLRVFTSVGKLYILYLSL